LIFRAADSKATGGMNTQLHAVSDAEVRPVRSFMTVSQISGYIGACALDLLPCLSSVRS
jgi:hypothetical protein